MESESVSEAEDRGRPNGTGAGKRHEKKLCEPRRLRKNISLSLYASDLMTVI